VTRRVKRRRVLNGNNTKQFFIIIYLHFLSFNYVDQAYGGDMGKIKQKITVCERNQKIYGGAVVRPIAASIRFLT